MTIHIVKYASRKAADEATKAALVRMSSAPASTKLVPVSYAYPTITGTGADEVVHLTAKKVGLDGRTQTVRIGIRRTDLPQYFSKLEGTIRVYSSAVRTTTTPVVDRLGASVVRVVARQLYIVRFTLTDNSSMGSMTAANSTFTHVPSGAQFEVITTQNPPSNQAGRGYTFGVQLKSGQTAPEEVNFGDPMTFETTASPPAKVSDAGAVSGIRGPNSYAPSSPLPNTAGLFDSLGRKYVTANLGSSGLDMTPKSGSQGRYTADINVYRMHSQDAAGRYVIADGIEDFTPLVPGSLLTFSTAPTELLSTAEVVSGANLTIPKGTLFTTTISGPETLTFEALEDVGPIDFVALHVPVRRVTTYPKTGISLTAMSTLFTMSSDIPGLASSAGTDQVSPLLVDQVPEMQPIEAVQDHAGVVWGRAVRWDGYRWEGRIFTLPEGT